ncbi:MULTISPECIES: helix-turn-helix domain-containing protein [Francisella]|uniref:XRE family transcriptional regulator n=1 Tax=Francisella opportunistica TaxID=2016517 RepID=A0A345JQ23_9GAMM|nr:MULTISPECIES: helix-turn-helix transcriptional regulator [Francisella]APC91108.1 transcriptional regulator, XRE family [Francisella sp. MA067296]AXH29419.1 XRE family transcriptional regulator [Francisella opportunistica]AXH31071.1 XRE family transcriptional regulator [Francisella opportunistica]AXH32716.1 XRE family transcriptional regulator [Francisella opportunistica]
MDIIQIGQEIANIRKSKKISQQKMSDDINISRTTISNIENGSVTDVGIKKIIRIIDYLGYEISFKEKSLFPVFEDLLNG